MRGCKCRRILSLRGESFFSGGCDGHLCWPTVVSLSVIQFVCLCWFICLKCQSCVCIQMSEVLSWYVKGFNVNIFFMSKVWVGDLWHVCVFNCHCHLWCCMPFWDVQWGCLCFVLRLSSFYVKKVSCDLVNYVGSWKWTFMPFEVWPWQIWRLVQVFGQILCCEKHLMCCCWVCIVTWCSPAPMLTYVVNYVMVREGLKFHYYGVWQFLMVCLFWFWNNDIILSWCPRCFKWCVGADLFMCVANVYTVALELVNGLCVPPLCVYTFMN